MPTRATNNKEKSKVDRQGSEASIQSLVSRSDFEHDLEEKDDRQTDDIPLKSDIMQQRLGSEYDRQVVSLASDPKATEPREYD